MLKKLFVSLMLGFGATLGVFVALAMPPGGWGVAVGVGLGLLGCVPLLLVLMMLIGRGHGDRRLREADYQEAPQPIIIIQQPEPAVYGYMDGSGYGYVAEPENYRTRPEWVLPSHRRRVQPEPYYQPQLDYYGPEYGYEPGAYQQYDTPPPQPQQYDAYYGPPTRNGYQVQQPEYYDGYESGYEYEQPRLERRNSQPKPARRPVRSRRVSQPQEAVEADFRMIGDNEQ